MGKEFWGFLEGNGVFLELFFLPCYTYSFIHALSHHHATLFWHFSSPWHSYHFIFILCDQSQYTQPLKQLFLMQDDTASFRSLAPPRPPPSTMDRGHLAQKHFHFLPGEARSPLSIFEKWHRNEIGWHFENKKTMTPKNIFSYFTLNSSR